MNFLPYILHWLICRAGSNLAGNFENNESTSVNLEWKYESPYKTDNANLLRRDILEYSSEDFDNISGLYPTKGINSLITLRTTNASTRWWKLFPQDTSRNLHKRKILLDHSKNISTDGAYNTKDFILYDQIPDIRQNVDVERMYEVGQIRVGSTHDMRKLVKLNPVHQMRVFVQFDPTHVKQKAVQSDTTLNFRNDPIWKPIELYSAHTTIEHVQRDQTHDMNEQVQLHDTQNIENPGHLHETHNMQMPIQIQETLNMQKSVQVHQNQTMRKPVQVHRTHNMRKPVQAHQTHNMQKPVQVHQTHNMQKPVQVHQTHNMRKPVQVHQTHNMRQPVQVHQTHYMQKPVQLEQDHDLRRPVKVEPMHNLRKPVKLMESHDLRWPVVEEPDHGKWSPISETDIFRSSKGHGKLMKIIQDYIQKRSKTNFVDQQDPLHQLLYEDEFLMSMCAPENLVSYHSVSNIGTNPRNTAMKVKSEYKNIFHESIKACGIPFNHSTEGLSRERKSTKWPWMVSLQQYSFDRFWHKCAGSLLNNLWVITAAHCVESRPKWDFLLQLGMEKNSQQHIERLVDRISIHPKFNILNLDHDIALLRMDSSVDFQPNIVPVCLPWKPDEIQRKKAVALGWRLDTERSNNNGSSREKTVPVLTNKECEVMFSETGSSEGIQKSFLCASFQNERQDSCIGDSGGPLAILDDNGRWLLAGLYSWGKSCTKPNQPEVYIRISGYADWIEDTISCYEENMNLHGMN